MAGGGNIECNSKCSHIEWYMAGHLFAASMRILPLGGYDMVLRVDTLRRLGPIGLDLRSIPLPLITGVKSS